MYNLLPSSSSECNFLLFLITSVAKISLTFEAERWDAIDSVVACVQVFQARQDEQVGGQRL